MKNTSKVQITKSIMKPQKPLEELDMMDAFLFEAATEDVFGDDRMLYTVKSVVTENEKLVYNDGVSKIIDDLLKKVRIYVDIVISQIWQGI